jgi:hypothetical protein
MKKFTQIPNAIQEDIVNGKLIGNDLVVYNYLVSKAAHGRPIFYTNERMGRELGGMSYGKISASLSRLKKANHISRFKTYNRTATKLETAVLQGGKMIVRGES